MKRLPIKVLPYDLAWPRIFEKELARIQHALLLHIVAIHHIGSTSIPNMAAKPIIDILLVCDSIDHIQYIAVSLQHLGYHPIRRHIIPHFSFFTWRADKTIRYHVHIHERGSPQIQRHLAFRDYLIQHPVDAEQYALLKKQLAATVGDIEAYILGKDKFVQAIDAKAKRWIHAQKITTILNTGPPMQEWSAEKIMKAMVANLNVHMTYFAQYLNSVEFIRKPGCTIVNSGLNDDTFNYVLDADFNEQIAPQKIAEVTEYFQKKGVPFSWWVSPFDQPANLGTLLEKNGYKNSENNTGMYLDLDTWDDEVPFPCDLQIKQAKDARTLKDYALVLANNTAAFEAYFSQLVEVITDDDPIEFFVGYVKGKPVVRGLICYFAQVAGLHWLSTHPAERKKGYGSAMQAFRLKRAKEKGYHVAVLQASAQGYPLYKKLGYQTCGEFKEYVPIAATIKK